MPWNKVYLAGPFFNEAQLALINTLEKSLVEMGFQLFSPRQSNDSLRFAKLKPDQPGYSQAAQLVFDANVEALRSCDWVLAVLPYLQEPHTEAVLVREGEGRVRPFHVPDSGTVWEMGFVYGRKPIVGFLDNQKMPLNLMLSKACTFIVRNMFELGCWLGTFAHNWKGTQL